jgi:hypothetical protein
MSRISNTTFGPGDTVASGTTNTKFTDVQNATGKLNNNNIRNAGIDVSQIKNSTSDQTFIKASGVGLGTGHPLTVGNDLILTAAPTELARVMTGGILKTATTDDLLRIYYQVWVSEVEVAGGIDLGDLEALSTSAGICFICWLQYATNSAGTAWLPVPNQVEPVNITTGTSAPRNRFGILCGERTAQTATSVMTIPLGAFSAWFKNVDGEYQAEHLQKPWDNDDGRNWSGTRAYHLQPTSNLEYYGFRVVCMGAFAGDVYGSPLKGALVMHDQTTARGQIRSPFGTVGAADEIKMTFGDASHPTQIGFMHMRKN